MVFDSNEGITDLELYYFREDPLSSIKKLTISFWCLSTKNIMRNMLMIGSNVGEIIVFEDTDEKMKVDIASLEVKDLLSRSELDFIVTKWHHYALSFEVGKVNL